MFDIVEPIEVTDANLVSNVLETPAATYNGAVGYSVDDLVSVYGGPSNTTATIYRSLTNGNIGHTPSTSPTHWVQVGTAYSTWSAAVTYAVDAIVTYNNYLYIAILSDINKSPGIAANLGVYWTELEPSNRWAMFDNQIDTQTIWYEELTVEIANNPRFDTLVMLGLIGSSVTVTVERPDSTVLFTDTYSLVDKSGYTNYWEHFFNPVTRRSSLTVRNLPILSGLTLRVTVNAVAGNVGVGKFGFGRTTSLGDLLYGVEMGYINYSDISANDFGRRAVVERGYKKQGDFDLRVFNAYWDRVYSTVVGFRATPVIVIADQNYDMLVFFGLITSARKNIPYREYATLRLRIEDF